MKTNITMGLGNKTYEDLYKEAEKRFKPINKFLKLEKYKNKRILDDGCGCGWLTNQLSKLTKESKIYGIDPEENDIIFAKKKNSNIKYLVADGHKLPFNKNSFDIVISHEIIEHINSPKKYLSEISRVLKKEGTLYLSTPNRLFPFEFHYNLPFISWLPAKMIGIFAKQKYKRLYTIFRLRKMLKDKNLVITKNISLEMIKDNKNIYFGKRFFLSLNIMYKITRYIYLNNFFLNIMDIMLPQKYIITKLIKTNQKFS